MGNLIKKLYIAVSALVTATRDTLSERLRGVRDTASSLYNKMMENMRYGQKTLKDIVEKEVGEEKDQQQEENVDLTLHEHERALKGAFRSFMMPGKPKTDIDSYLDQTKRHIKTLIEKQLKELGSAEIIMTVWIISKKSIEPLIKSDPEDAKNAQELDDGITGDNYIRVEMLFNSVMTKFFQGGDNNDLIEHACIHEGTNWKS